jgi:hypothetical protein
MTQTGRQISRRFGAKGLTVAIVIAALAVIAGIVLLVG